MLEVHTWLTSAAFSKSELLSENVLSSWQSRGQIMVSMIPVLHDVICHNPRDMVVQYILDAGLISSKVGFLDYGSLN